MKQFDKNRVKENFEEIVDENIWSRDVNDTFWHLAAHSKRDNLNSSS